MAETVGELIDRLGLDEALNVILAENIAIRAKVYELAAAAIEVLDFGQAKAGLEGLYAEAFKRLDEAVDNAHADAPEMKGLHG